MRWSLGIIFSLVLAAAIAAPNAQAGPAWGCCIPDTPTDCFDGSVIGYQGKFLENFVPLCRESLLNQSLTNQEVKDRYIEDEERLDTCSEQRRSGGRCELGCCCQNATTPRTGTQTTREACGILAKQDPQNDPREYKPLTPGLSCAQVCAGTTTPTPGTSFYRVSGIVVQRGTTPERGLGSVTVFPSSNTTNRATTAADGRFTLPAAVAAGDQVFVAQPSSATTPASCRTSTLSRTVSGAITDLKILVDCSPATCTNPAPNVTGFALDAGSNSVSFRIGLAESCGRFITYTVKRCNDRAMTANCSVESTSAPDYTGRGLRENTEYCYSVSAQFATGAPNSTDASFIDASGTRSAGPKCVVTGVSRCMTRAAGTPLQWCGTDRGAPAVIGCDDSNRANVTERCSQGTLCVEQSGSARCAAAPSCSQCNGLLGIFAKLPLSIPFEDRVRACNALTTVSPAAARCYKDNALRDGEQTKPTIVPVYNSCASVADCGAYASAGTCVQNPCGVTANGVPEQCSWVVLNRELGQGVCTGASKPACGTCDRFGACTPELCAQISPDCYYDNDANSLTDEWYANGKPPRCIAKSEMACRYYDTQNDCTRDGANAEFSIAYSGAGRTSGNNSLLKPSSDKLSLGVCSWVPATSTEPGYCIKNADQSPGAREDDCIENGAYRQNRLCVLDRTPPTTTLAPRASGLYGLHELRALPFTVTDDTTPPEGIKTYVCFYSGAPCYPTRLAGAVDINNIQNGTYGVAYYSADANGNLEPVKTASLRIVDLGYATLLNVTVTQNDQ